MSSPAPLCPYCEQPITAYAPVDDMRSMLRCKCSCTTVRLYLLVAPASPRNRDRLTTVWGPGAEALLEQARWATEPDPCVRCNRDELARQAEHLPYIPIREHTCGRS